MNKKKILAVTGIRSEYDILYPVINFLNSTLDFEIKLVVSSAHLSDFHGNTFEKIEQDNFQIADKIDCLLSTDRNVQRSKGVGLLTYSLSQTVDREKPDFLFVIGDREESIATAIVGNYMNVITAHLGGGDPVWGNADDPIRMAVSKLAHIHFTTSKEYAENLINNLYEDPYRVFFTGNPALTNIKNTEVISLKELSEYLKFDISNGNYIVLIKHPLSSEEKEASGQMKITLEALEKFCLKNNFKVVASYPNTDPGSQSMLKVIKKYEKKDFICFNKTLPRKYFVNLIRNTKALVGNSSMGILEAPFYRLPVVNIGNRQQGRMNAGNVVFVNHNVDEICNQIEIAVFDKKYREKINSIISPYGQGNTPEIIYEVLRSIDIKDPKWIVKKSLC